MCRPKATMIAPFETALNSRVDDMLDACTKCGRFETAGIDRHQIVIHTADPASASNRRMIISDWSYSPSPKF
jgi:hypothetical protein